MAKRKMKYIQSPEELIQGMQSNKQSRLTSMKAVRDQCFGSLPRKHAFFDSDVMPALLDILQEASGQPRDSETQETVITCLNVLASLAQAETVRFEHCQVLHSTHLCDTSRSHSFSAGLAW